jgi:hypothetical protein
MVMASFLIFLVALPVTLGIAAAFLMAFVLDTIGDAGDGPTET